MVPPVRIGDKVTAIAFTDCFGNYHEERPGLVVASVRLVECKSMAPYWRIMAEGPGLSSFEGAARFFGL